MSMGICGPGAALLGIPRSAAVTACELRTATRGDIITADELPVIR